MDNAQPSVQSSRERFQFGSERFAAGDYAGAETAFRQAIQACPGDQHAALGALYFNLARAIEEQGRAPEAAQALRRYLEHVPDAPDAASTRAHLQALETALARQYYEAGRRAYEGGDFTSAELNFRQALQALPAAYGRVEGALHYDLGLALAEQQRNDDAAQALNRYLQLVPDAADAAAVREHVRNLGGAPG